MSRCAGSDGKRRSGESCSGRGIDLFRAFHAHRCKTRAEDMNREHREEIDDRAGGEDERVIAPRRIEHEPGRLRHDHAADAAHEAAEPDHRRSEEHTSELQSLMRISYAVFCLKKKNTTHRQLADKTTTR